MPRKKVEIIYADDDIIVVNKPAGVSVTKDRSGAQQLVDILSQQLSPQASSKLRLVHRLDKDTSDAMILARNKESQSGFSSYFEKRLIMKTYLALVTGPVSAPEGTIDARLARDHRHPNLMRAARKKGKEAITEWKLLADFGSLALLAVHPLTGRTHQIRVHLPSIGLPLAIDAFYGSKRPLFLSDFKPDYRLAQGRTERPLIDRLTLHAYQIEVNEPLPNMPDCFVAGLGKKFAATMKMLTKHNTKGLDAFSNPDDFTNIIENQRLY
ncbi:MAG: RluA family pseudouridine synthase [Planctomycetota bacterium]|jgi:RluA family pseudouridine synthase